MPALTARLAAWLASLGPRRAGAVLAAAIAAPWPLLVLLIAVAVEDVSSIFVFAFVAAPFVAALVGFRLARLAIGAPSWRPTIALALLVVVITAAVTGMLQGGLVRLEAVLFGAFVGLTYGLIIFGLPALVIAVPSAILWAALLRRVFRPSRYRPRGRRQIAYRQLVGRVYARATRPRSGCRTRAAGRFGGEASMQLRRALLPFAITLAALMAVPATAMAATPISVEVIVGQSCVSGTGPANKTVLAALRTPDRRLRARLRTMSDPSGSWFGCFGLFGNTLINGGDRLRVEIGSQARTVVIPRMEPHINRESDQVTGRVKPFAEVDILVSHRKNFKSSAQHFFSVVADGSGNYFLDTTGTVNLLGGDAVTVVTGEGNDLFGALAAAPFLVIEHANNFVQGQVNNGTNIELSLFDQSGNLKARVSAGPIVFGIFIVAMFDGNGDAVYPLGRDRLVANFAGDADLRIPVGALRGTASDDVITGRCMPNAPYQLVARNRVFTGKTDGNGRLTRDVTSRMNLRRGDPLALACMYPTGDLWTKESIAL